MFSKIISLKQWWMVMITSSILILGLLLNQHHQSNSTPNDVYFIFAVIVTICAGVYALTMIVRD